MTSSGHPTSQLRVHTTALSVPLNLISHLDPSDPQLWMREGNGIAGNGTALRLEFSGPTRFRDAAETWRRIAAAAHVTDEVRATGTGLIALGTFTFADASATTSVLRVPRTIIGRSDGAAWVTRIRTADDTEFDPLPTASALGSEYRLSLRAGQMSPDAFRSAVADATARIQTGELSKVVLARDLVGRVPVGADLRRPLVDLSLGYPSCWTFAVDGLFGASPETLIRSENGVANARVLAGTISRGSDGERDEIASIALATSDKNLGEHEFAIRSVRETLAPFVSDLEWSEQPFALKLPNLWHLATDVRATLSGSATSLDLVAALHPTAAVAGTPTPDALRLIAECEPGDRGRYAGAVGWLNATGDGQWAVALRCAQITPNNTVTAWAGCGIVAGSDPDAELAETDIKFRPIIDALG
ncbi:isochorismate synthase [Klugiella xanthotipulae]|uniref:isochorismate synthase n=1 Tax=Klugiella xanthotipulae TaxID=244735 RepID=UPI001FE53339|nr:isochorismate synthase [Klugiella xanthotipulae]